MALCNALGRKVGAGLGEKHMAAGVLGCIQKGLGTGCGGQFSRKWSSHLWGTSFMAVQLGSFQSGQAVAGQRTLSIEACY